MTKGNRLRPVMDAETAKLYAAIGWAALRKMDQWRAARMRAVLGLPMDGAESDAWLLHAEEQWRVDSIDELRNENLRAPVTALCVALGERIVREGVAVISSLPDPWAVQAA